MQVLSSAYFPSLAYVGTLLQDPNLVIDLHEHFVKQSIRTRAEILSANGIVQLNVPIVHASNSKQALDQIKIDYSKNWQAEHWRTITSAYANAPHFEHYAYDIKCILDQRYTYLHEINLAILEWINRALDLQLEICWSPEFTGLTSPDKKTWLGRELIASKGYQQVFNGKDLFVQNLSIIDGLMNEGPLLRTHFLPR